MLHVIQKRTLVLFIEDIDKNAFQKVLKYHIDCTIQDITMLSDKFFWHATVQGNFSYLDDICTYKQVFFVK